MPTPAQLAKGALRRLAQARQEPTPAHYARAYADEAQAAGAPLLPDAGPPAEAWPALIDRLARGLDRSARHWTAARKKDSLQRVLASSRSDAQRLQQRLGQLLTAWEKDQADEGVAVARDEVEAVQGLPLAAASAAPSGLAADQSTRPPTRPPTCPPDHPPDHPPTRQSTGQSTDPEPATDAHPRLLDALQTTVRASLPADEPRAVELADALAALARRVTDEGATPALADAVADVCQRARCLLGLRHALVDELLALCDALTSGLTDGADEGSPARAEGDNLRQRLDGAHSARAVRAARQLLDESRARQQALQGERLQAREAIKQLVQQVLTELADLASANGRYTAQLQGHAQAVAAADSLPRLADVVQQMLGDSRAVQALVAGARARLAAEQSRAGELQARVLGLEGELRRLADEVCTDALTQVANRRGLAQAFEQECAAATAAAGPQGAGAAPLAVGLIDIDNFKRLNDSLGHAAGDVALQSLAARVKEWLRPVDHIARFGGEEFVVLLPATPVAEGQQVLTRLQRRLSASLFMHDGQEVFVTFSAGVTAWRPGEAVDAALARADEGLYEAKRTGKNRTCIA